MTQVRRYLVNLNSTLLPLAWISLQDNGSVSLGLSERCFTTIPLNGKNFVFNFYNRVTIEFLLASNISPSALLVNPHLTFHPPIYFHLTDNSKNERWAGIADVDLILSQETVFPWIRIISRSPSKLKTFTARANLDNDKNIILPIHDPSLSVGLGVNIVSSTLTSSTNVLDFFEWQGRKFEIFSQFFPAQDPSIIWYHQC